MLSCPFGSERLLIAFPFFPNTRWNTCCFSCAQYCQHTLLGLVLGFGEGDLIHGGYESCAVDNDRIIAHLRDLFRASLCFHHGFLLC